MALVPIVMGSIVAWTVAWALAGLWAVSSGA